MKQLNSMTKVKTKEKVKLTSLNKYIKNIWLLFSLVGYFSLNTNTTDKKILFLSNQPRMKHSKHFVILLSIGEFSPASVSSK